MLLERRPAEVLTVVLAWMGGLYSFMRIADAIFFQRPLLKGDVERKLVIQHADGAPEGWYPELLLLVYVANARMQPTTVRRWSLAVQRHWNVYEAGSLPLNAETLLGLPHPVALEEVTRSVLEYGKGVWGWLRFEVRGILGGALERGCHLTLTGMDSMGRKHRIRARLLPGEIERLHAVRRANEP